ncbi:hypothetical protein PX554_11405 [Sphingomonas sp. H39-1-10]|uniref:hypothetical protein n=1 Tax=Sphingomonas TaxID=13687 RepID=UPI000883F7BB|nr:MULTISPECIES: hypothetical protein [Sphingomonas]MDF0488738.1 hypothetical protein [Sphingomonas pollutisoli]SDA13141.1 hypothetical protein SAMN03159340_00379 [Sphingomonas sp. NFR15]
MSDDRVTDTPHTTIIERRGSGATWLIAIVLAVGLVIGAMFLTNKSRNDTIRTDAVSGAAKDIGDSAKKVGDSAARTADSAAQ